MILSLNGGSAAQQTNKLFWITAVWSNINFVIYAYVLVYVYTVHMLKTKQNKKTEFKRKKFLKNISRIIFAVQESDVSVETKSTGQCKSGYSRRGSHWALGLVRQVSVN